jgi:hypothetical protein
MTASKLCGSWWRAAVTPASSSGAASPMTWTTRRRKVNEHAEQLRRESRTDWFGAVYDLDRSTFLAPVGVRNSDQELDLRLRNAAAQTCQHLSRRHGREHPAFGCLALGARACGASRAGPECVRLRLHPHSVRGQVPRAGPREGAIGPSLADGQLRRSRRSQG